MRILNEAELFAPQGYQIHLDNIAAAYIRILKRGRAVPATLDDFSDPELEVFFIVNILMGARGYLSRRYAYKARAPPTPFPIMSSPLIAS